MIDDSDLTEAQRRARKIKPQYGEGELVKVAYARNQAEAELIAGFLLEEGVPSVIRRNQGFDVPDFLAAGPRDILVAASGADVARDVLHATSARKGSDPSFARETHPLVARRWVRVLAITVVLVLGISSIAGAVAALLG